MSGNRPILSVVVLLLGVSLTMGARAHAGSVAASKPASSGAALDPSELAVVRLINSYRTRNGAPALLVGRALSRAAQAHSTDMARRGYFDHGAFEARLRRFGVRSPYIGENLASGTRPLTPVAIVRMWIQTPPHPANLLGRRFRRIAV